MYIIKIGSGHLKLLLAICAREKFQKESLRSDYVKEGDRTFSKMEITFMCIVLVLVTV